MIGVLMMAHGTPERLEQMEDYLARIRGGRRPSPALLEEMTGNYRAIGGRSPLTDLTLAQSRSLADTLGEPFRVFVGMRNVKVDKVRPWVLLYVGLGGITLMWVIKLTGANLIILPTAAGIIGGTMTCGFWCLAMIWTDRKFLPKAYQMGTGLVVLNVIGGLFMAIMGLIAWWEFGVGKMGGLRGGFLAYLFLVAMVAACMIVMAIINSGYRKKGLIT